MNSSSPQLICNSLFCLFLPFLFVSAYLWSGALLRLTGFRNLTPDAFQKAKALLALILVVVAILWYFYWMGHIKLGGQ
jgi:predicted small integral membrane protein